MTKQGGFRRKKGKMILGRSVNPKILIEYTKNIVFWLYFFLDLLYNLQ
jgi:hypothetical protein